MQGVMDVVIPLPFVTGGKQRHAIVFIFDNQLDVTIRKSALQPGRQFRQPAFVPDGMDRIQAQPVEAEFIQPVAGIFKKEFAHFRLAEIDGGAPGRVHIAAKERLGIKRKIIPVRAEVIIDHVQNDREPLCVRTFDQIAKRVRRASPPRRPTPPEVRRAGAIEAGPEVVIVTDVETVIVDANDAIAELVQNDEDEDGEWEDDDDSKEKA